MTYAIVSTLWLKYSFPASVSSATYLLSCFLVTNTATKLSNSLATNYRSVATDFKAASSLSFLNAEKPPTKALYAL